MWLMQRRIHNALSLLARYTHLKPVKGRSLRTACGTVTVAMLLASAEPAAAHFGVSPGVVSPGTVELLVELPAAYEPEPGSVRVVGRGIETLSSRGAAGAPGGESRWLVRARVDAPAGPLPVAVRARNAAGGSFTLRTTLTVVPGQGSGGFPRLAVAVALAFALALAALLVARRRA
jgi:hypothetical protein